ncbi:unnamed protein product [Medioppia subpectinata]|uniref:N-terminal kinase-like protein n=1 Tax=Medioppia subpectinata TaxID=1979941 RepID=A0A7R9Q004_9ACAR|nr:unnamed protein product [Medioppia subpectinata]CAG2106702.1 unnamed protein product [Medioppia subpectinata]
MWSFWSRDPTKDFGYEMQDIVSGDDKSIWILQNAKKKSSGELVSIFRYELKPSGDNHIDRAKNAVKRLKTLRHPSILTYSDKYVYVVTEHVVPLEQYLQSISDYTQQQRQLAISWGLLQVAKGLGFLINDCNLSHNNISMPSIYVNSGGVWRIAGLEYVCSNADDSYPVSKALSFQHKYTPPERVDQTRRQSGAKWSTDSWGLGCLIWEAFNGLLPETNKLKSMGRIPKSLSTPYTELISNNANSRLSPADFVTKCRAQNGFFKNNFIDSMLFLEEIQIKDTIEKNRFFTNLDNHLDSFPKDICKNKILPQLVTAFEFSAVGSAILGPLFKIGKSLEEEEYQKKIVPCVVKLFACKDRATRAKLLQQMETFINYIQPNVVNDSVFPHVCQGFLDSNPVIREQTVKCMLHMASKLNYHNLNEEIVKNFSRLQARDEEGGIRTNTTVCLGKIASHLHPQTRQTVLIPSFLRSMRDPFPPARIAGILALSATQNFYSLRECSTRVMPALCHLTMDPEKQVREQAFKALKGFVSKLEKVSEDPSLAEQMEADLNAAGSNVSSTLAASWAGWAVTSLASKFYRSKPSTTDQKANTSQTTANSTAKSDDNKSDADRPQTPHTPGIQKSESGDSQQDFDEEVWGSIDADSSQPNATTRKSLDGWDEEEVWEDDQEFNDETKETTKVTTNSAKVNSGDDFFDKFTNDSTPKSATNWSKTTAKPKDEFGETNDKPVINTTAATETEQQTQHKATAEQRRRNRNLAERKGAAKKGPMKLGAQRIT